MLPRGGVQETQAPSQRHRDGAAVCFVDGQLALCAANISDPLARVRHETPPFPFRARDSLQPASLIKEHFTQLAATPTLNEAS